MIIAIIAIEHLLALYKKGSYNQGKKVILIKVTQKEGKITYLYKELKC